jgi:hypothetical protein
MLPSPFEPFARVRPRVRDIRLLTIWAAVACYLNVVVAGRTVTRDKLHCRCAMSRFPLISEGRQRRHNRATACQLLCAIARALAAVQSADLIAKWIAQISQIEFCRPALTPSGRVLDALAAARDACIVKGFNLFRAVASESYCAAKRVASLCTSLSSLAKFDLTLPSGPLRVKRVGFVMSAVCPVYLQQCCRMSASGPVADRVR